MRYKLTETKNYHQLLSSGRWEKIGTRKTTLHRYFDFVECADKVSQRMFKTSLDSSVCILRDGEINQYQLESDYERYIQGFDSFFGDAMNIKYAGDHMIVDSEKFIKWLQNNCAEDRLNGLSNKELAEILRKRHEMHQVLVAWQWFGFTGKYAIEKSIEKRLAKYSLSDKLAEKILSLSTPVYMIEEDLRVKEIAVNIQNNKLMNADLKEKINSHIKKYGYFVMYDETYSQMTYGLVSGRIKEFIKNKELAKEIENDKERFFKNKKEFDSFIKGRRFSLDDKNFFNFAHKYARFMELRNQYRGFSSFLSKPIFALVAQRLKTSLENLLCFSDKEIIKFLLEEKIFDKKEAVKRFKNSVLVYEKGKPFVEIDCEKIKWIVNTITNFEKEVGIIKGKIAFLGKARGIVVIINSTEQIKNLHKGNILVSSMTRPDFLMAINKAAAIVTDEGGITCHAAIISRELKKPCIIGTKIATQVLKDGDLVEVDADKGIIKIIKKYGN